MDQFDFGGLRAVSSGFYYDHQYGDDYVGCCEEDGFNDDVGCCEEDGKAKNTPQVDQVDIVDLKRDKIGLCFGHPLFDEKSERNLFYYSQDNGVCDEDVNFCALEIHNMKIRDQAESSRFYDQGDWNRRFTDMEPIECEVDGFTPRFQKSQQFFYDDVTTTAMAPDVGCCEGYGSSISKLLIMSCPIMSIISCPKYYF